MSEIMCNGRNIYIENKTPQDFHMLSVENGEILVDGKKVFAGEVVYACLHCKKLKNVTFLVKEEEVKISSFIFSDEEYFQAFLELINKKFPNIRVSEQNKKINSYAFALSEKLVEGIETTIIDSKDEEEAVCCPVCGMQCDPNIPYCMECGASV